MQARSIRLTQPVDIADLDIRARIAALQEITALSPEQQNRVKYQEVLTRHRDRILDEIFGTSGHGLSADPVMGDRQ